MRELFEQEYRKHEKSLFLVAVAYLHNTEDAKDVLQEAALSAYKGVRFCSAACQGMKYHASDEDVLHAEA